VLTTAGELLVDPSTFTLRVQHDGGVATLREYIPNDPSLSGAWLYVQGLVDGSPGPELTNGLLLTLSEGG
jgi:hypothetical protein